MKPLGHKSYGSIPHLIGSKLGEGDHHVHEGQHRIATEKKRDKNDIIIVQEKLDGSNVAVAKIDGKIIALTRSGYEAHTSKYSQHHIFNEWVKFNEHRFITLLADGERICGEWLAMAHGTKYDLFHEPFVAFDIMRGHYKFPYFAFRDRIESMLSPFTQPNLIWYGDPFPVEHIPTESKHGGEQMEGVIYRVERNGEVDFLAKFVHSNYVAGKYFEANNNGQITWNN